jgi:tripartite-type tricarboxylate transporter receptor subunit TctC
MVVPHRGTSLGRRHLLSALAAPSAMGQAEFPQRALRLIVPVAAGGSQDSVARLLARFMAGPLGQPIIMENRPGAAGNIGFEIVARARPDGYMLGAGSDNLSINKALFPLLGFDPIADFAPIAQATSVPQILVVRGDSPSADLAAFLDRAAREPLALGTGGNGSLAHMLQALLQELTGRRWTHVPYRGGAPAVNDLIAGSIHAMIGNIGAVAEQMQAGLLRGLAVSTPGRVATLPRVPSVTEFGMADAEVMGWHGLVAPRGTPGPVVARLYAAAVEALRLPELRLRLNWLGISPSEAGPEALGRRMAEDAMRWEGVVRRGGLRAD